MKQQELSYHNKAASTIAEIATVQKSNMQKMHNVVSSKMETTTQIKQINSNHH